MAQMVAIIDYGSGNLRSVEKAFERAARERGLACRVAVTDDPDVVRSADRLVLPGVGAFASCMEGLKARAGVLEALEHAVLVEKRPFLGICVGMQLLAGLGMEFGSSRGLGWLPGKVVAIDTLKNGVRSPHMGWNSVVSSARHPLFAGQEEAAFYFAHSYYFEVENISHCIAFTDHGGELVAAVGRDNILGVQFHPEKSQKAGLSLIANFLTWTPA